MAAFMPGASPPEVRTARAATAGTVARGHASEVSNCKPDPDDLTPMVAIPSPDEALAPDRYHLRSSHFLHVVARPPPAPGRHRRLRRDRDLARGRNRRTGSGRTRPSGVPGDLGARWPAGGLDRIRHCRTAWRSSRWAIPRGSEGSTAGRFRSSTPGAPRAPTSPIWAIPPMAPEWRWDSSTSSAGTARLVDSGAPYYLDWAPDGSRLAVHIDTTSSASSTSTGTGPRSPPSRAFSRHPSSSTMAACWLPPAATSRAWRCRGVRRTGADRADHRAARSSPPRQRGLLAYTDTADAADPRVARRSIAARGTASPQTVSEGPVVAFEWSPSGEQLLFLTVNAEGTAADPPGLGGGLGRSLRGAAPNPGDDQPATSRSGINTAGSSPCGPRMAPASCFRWPGRTVAASWSTTSRAATPTRVSGGRFASWAPGS